MAVPADHDNGQPSSSDDAGAGGAGGGRATIEELLALGIERVEQEGAPALEDLCARHPEHAAVLRHRLAALDRVGLLQPPPRIGRFTLLGPLGRGGMGVVHLAHDEQHDRLVALKTLPARLLSSPRSAERFRREVTAVAALRHPSIVPVVDAGESDDGPWLALEYVPGRTLAQALDDARSEDRGTPTGEPWPPGALGSRPWWESACRALFEVAEGLHHAHRHGVVHRDVKPENVLLGDDGRARLLDFGLALVAGQPTLTTTGEFTGTPSYAAPEQVSSDSGPVDARTDVHALGATLYELLTLRRPFGDDNAAEVARRVLSEDPARPSRVVPGLPRELDTICMTALEKRPDRRYASAAAFAADLAALLAGEPIAARDPSAVARLLRAARRRPAAAVACLLFAVLAIGGPLQLWRSNLRIAGALRLEEEQRERAQAAAVAAEAALAELRAERARADAADDESRRWRDQSAAIDAFLLSILVAPDALRDDADASVGDLLDRASRVAAEAFAGDPELLASMQLHIGKADVLVGRFAEAAAQFAAAWESVAPLQGRHPDALRLEIRQDGTTALLRQRRGPEAVTWARAALELGETQLAPDDTALLGLRSHLAAALDQVGERAEARELYREVLAARRTDPDTPPTDLAKAITNYAAVLDGASEDERKALFDEAVAIQATLAPTDDYEAAKALTNRLWIGFYDTEATAADIEALRHALQVVRRRAGERSTFFASTAMLLGKLLQRREGSDFVEIEALLAESVSAYRELAPADSKLVVALDWWAQQLHAMGRHEQALAAVAEAIGVRRTTGEPDMVPSEALLVAKLVVLLRTVGRTAEAEQILTENPAARAYVDAGTAFG